MESNNQPPATVARRLWHIVRVLYYMLRKGVSKHKLMLDFQLALQRGKLAGKAISNLLAFHHHNHHHQSHSSQTSGGGGYYSAFTCRSVDPNMAFYNPREVEFSCSNTPAYVPKRKHRHYHEKQFKNYDAAAIAKVFEILNEVSDTDSVIASPSPAPIWSFGKSPAPVPQLRITDSPFPMREEEEADPRVDKAAEDFIKRFYEQLRLQPSAKPEYGHYRRSPLLGRA